MGVGIHRHDLLDIPGQVVAGKDHQPAAAAGLVAVGVVQEQRPELAAGGSQLVRVQGVIGVVADVGLVGDVAERVVTQRHLRAAVELGQGQPVELVVLEGFDQTTLVVVLAGQQIAHLIPAVVQVLDGAASARAG
ncbi:MAG: hypothetical protein ACRESV_03065, partial [Nevskiales bacterium]